MAEQKIENLERKIKKWTWIRNIFAAGVFLFPFGSMVGAAIYYEACQPLPNPYFNRPAIVKRYELNIRAIKVLDEVEAMDNSLRIDKGLLEKDVINTTESKEFKSYWEKVKEYEKENNRRGYWGIGSCIVGLLMGLGCVFPGIDAKYRVLSLKEEKEKAQNSIAKK